MTKLEFSTSTVQHGLVKQLVDPDSSDLILSFHENVVFKKGWRPYVFYMCMHVWASIILNFKSQPCEGLWETNSIRYFRAPFYPLEVSECKVASDWHLRTHIKAEHDCTGLWPQRRGGRDRVIGLPGQLALSTEWQWYRLSQKTGQIVLVGEAWDWHLSCTCKNILAHAPKFTCTLKNTHSHIYTYTYHIICVIFWL